MSAATHPKLAAAYADVDADLRAAALREVRRAAGRAVRATRDRNDAIRRARELGLSARAVGGAADLTHAAVLKIAAARA